MNEACVIWYKHPSEKWRRYLSCDDHFFADHVARQHFFNVSSYYKLGITVLVLPPYENPNESTTAG